MKIPFSAAWQQQMIRSEADRWEPKAMWFRRLVFACQMRMWPWQIPDNVVRYVSLDQRITDAEAAHYRQLAEKHGWLK